MKSMTKTAWCAVIGGVALDTALAALVILMVAEVYILTCLIVAVCAFLGVFVTSAALRRAHNRKRGAQALPEIETAGSSRLGQRFLVGLGVFLVGLGETLLSGMLFFVLGDYCSAQDYLSWAVPFMNQHFTELLILAMLVCPILNSALRQWLLVAGNILGPLLAFALMAAIASQIESIA